MTVGDVSEHLLTYGIHAERKSVYDDFLTLTSLGLTVGRMGTRPERYYLEERVFTLPELKMLTDAVLASRFITKENSREMIRKLSFFAGRHHAAELSRSFYVDHMTKTFNADVPDIIDRLQTALRLGVRVTYRYYDFTSRKEKRYHRNGGVYDVSPYALLWNDENYYLLAYDSEADLIKHFRVDKMENVRVTTSPVCRPEKYARFDPAAYSTKTFAMYGGREELVTFRCAERLSGVMLDRFGMSPTFFPERSGRFSFSVRVNVSPTFYGWVMSFGTDMEIVSPPSVREEFAACLADISARYRKTEKTEDKT